MYRRFLVLAIAAGCALAASNAFAAPERVRGTIGGVGGDTGQPAHVFFSNVAVKLAGSNTWLEAQ